MADNEDKKAKHDNDQTGALKLELDYKWIDFMVRWENKLALRFGKV